MSTDHIILNTQTGAFECLHCGATYRPGLPAPVNMVVAMSQSFVKDHQHCPPRAREPLIEPLIKRFEPGAPL
jgi:rubredoxin